MRAAVYDKAGQKLVVREVPTPKAEGNKAIIKVMQVGICGSDFSAYTKDARLDGAVLGHEYAGIVEDPGQNPHLKKGQRVTVMPFPEPCGECEECRHAMYNLCKEANIGKKGQSLGMDYPGALSEYVWAIGRFVFPIADNVSFEEGAMIEPLAVGLRAVKQAQVYAGARVLVTGAGFIAVASALLARMQGAAKVAAVVRNPARAQFMLDQGVVDAVFSTGDEDHQAQMRAFAGGSGFDCALECTGAGAMVNTCAFATKPAGRISLPGVGGHAEPVNLALLAVKEQVLVGSMEYTQDEFADTVAMVNSGRFNLMGFITRRATLDELGDIFKAKKNGQLDEVKIMVDPWK